MNTTVTLLLRIIFVAAIVGILSGCALVRVVDPLINPVSKKRPVCAKAETLHRTMLVADLHADTLMFDRGGVTGLQNRHCYSHVDIPRLKEGNVGFQMFTVATVTPIPYLKWMNGGLLNGESALSILQGWPVQTWNSPKQRGLYQAAKWRTNANGENLIQILTRGDLERYLQKHYHKRADGNWTPINPGNTPVATLLGLEGCHALGLNAKSTDAEIETALQEYWNAGFRSLALTHRFDNEFGGASEGRKGARSERGSRQGITPLGRRLLAGMARHGFILDLAHASDRLISDVLAEHIQLSIIISHTGVTYDGQPSRGQLSNRLTRVEDVQAIAERQGVVGIGVFKRAVGKPETSNAAHMISELSAIAGTKCLVLGSDMDGADRCGFAADGWNMLTQELQKQGMPDDRIRDVMGGNTIRFLLNALPTQ